MFLFFQQLPDAARGNRVINLPINPSPLRVKTGVGEGSERRSDEGSVGVSVGKGCEKIEAPTAHKCGNKCERGAKGVLRGLSEGLRKEVGS